MRRIYSERGSELFCIQNMRFRMVWRPKDSNLEFASPVMSLRFPEFKSLHRLLFRDSAPPSPPSSLHIRNVFEHVTFPHSAAKFTAPLRFSLLSREIIIPILIGGRKIIIKKKKRNSRGILIIWNIFNDINDP